MALRIATAGSVDDGKSTLIGRLLHDTKTVFEDQLAAVERASRRYGDGSTNLALLTDGLRAEREQGITIDVAYRYFATPARSFVVADTPGHAQYTRNMVTGASVSEVSIVLVDARTGLTEQTRRHLFVVSLLGVRHAVIAVNKMDLVGYSRRAFTEVADAVAAHLAALPHPVRTTVIPMSALKGDNVVEPSAAMDWYDGPTLLGLLETIETDPTPTVGARLAVQWVIRPHGTEHHDYRGFAGRLGGDRLAVGDEVVVHPAGSTSTVSSIRLGGIEVDSAEPGQSIAVELADDLDVGRGDLIVSAAGPAPVTSDEFVADVCWMVERPLEAGSRWALKHTTRNARAVVDTVVGRYDLFDGRLVPAPSLAMNDLGVVTVAATTPLAWDGYGRHTRGGAAILIDEATGMTAGALMIRDRSPFASAVPSAG